LPEFQFLSIRIGWNIRVAMAERTRAGQKKRSNEKKPV
jgi:hypothetical protein